MTLQTHLDDLVEELDRIHTDGRMLRQTILADGIPDFATAANGKHRHFPKEARKRLDRFTMTLYRNRPNYRRVIDRTRFRALLRQVIADLHAEGRFVDCTLPGSAVKAVDSAITARLQHDVRRYGLHFPAWTIGVESHGPFTLGPVTFRARENWIDEFDFPASLKDSFANTPQANHRWRDVLKKALADDTAPAHTEGVAQWVFSPLRPCPAVLSVEVDGYELGLSKQLGALVCKSALDAVSLVFEREAIFHQQLLHGDRQIPIGLHSLISTDGALWGPGSDMGPRMPVVSPDRAALVARENPAADLFDAIGQILNGVVDGTRHAQPGLAQRWATALDWFAEGQRERSDAMALAKIATAMDVLASVGRNAGIRAMAAHLTGRDASDFVVLGDAPKTLERLIKEIYDDGRSQILHGAKVDRMLPLADERAVASSLGRFLLLEAAVRLRTYTGPDHHKAFRTIPPPPTSPQPPAAQA